MFNVVWPQPEVIRFPVASPSITNVERIRLLEAFDSSWIGSNGYYNNIVESKLSKLFNQETALVSNGSVAITLALTALGLGPGDEIIVPSLTFAATASAVVHVGATPVFADVDLDTWQLSVSSIEKMITPQTRAIIAVHLYGQVADISKISELAKSHNFILIEDCAESTLARYENSQVGSFGDIATYSFFSNKLITCGEGGAISSSNPYLMERIKLLRGQGMDPQKRYYFIEPGFNFRLSNLHAAILDAQLERIEEITNERNKIENKYRELISRNAKFIEPRLIPNGHRSPWIYTCRISGISFETKLQLAKELANNGIETRPVFYPLNENLAFEKYRSDKTPNANLIATEGISLPTGSHMSTEDVEEVVDILASLVEEIL